ncbi:methionyl-tRNA formyltransferase [Prevotella sp. PCHR]|uniref:Methionyl-tRNA formyltransferase n=2 Tax=Xylanibacter caecicola TaxID=2736294 RepID=A0ABX2B610_9BACT|nr:methionyl-tRNA formyltransferase [Xylanibacter caecicola]NPE26213.1 methionyl-tRNA formyltransferase [Xylanibacter caecicola]
MTKKDLRIIFMGTPEFAVETLRALVEADYNVVAVVTQPDKPVGRHHETLQPSAVKQYAMSKGLPVLQPEKMKDPVFVEELRSFEADLQIVVAFRMLPEIVWNMPRYGTFNVHAALLPQYRGAAPINWAVINGEKQTGVTTFFLDHDIDTGRIIMQEPFEINDDYNVEDVYNGLMKLGAEIALMTTDRIIEGNGHVPSLPQDEMIATGDVLHHAPKIFKETCRIDWNMPAKNIYDFVRGLSPCPGAWTNIISADGKDTVLKIYKTSKTGMKSTSPCGTVLMEKGCMYVCTADELLKIDILQLSGKKRMNASDFCNGRKELRIKS